MSAPIDNEPPAEDDVATSDPISEQITVSGPVGNDPPLAEEDAASSDPISEPITVSGPVSNEPPSAEEEGAIGDPILGQITVNEPIELALAPAATDPVSGQITANESVSNEPPVPSFSWSCIDLVCYFLDTFTDSDGQITAWAWDFGDGNVSSNQRPAHIYTAAGIYTVSLEITDEDTATSDPISEQLTVSEPITTVGRVRRHVGQSNGFVERLHRTLLDEHFRVMGRTKYYDTVDEMQRDLESFLKVYNHERPHQGRGMNGRTPAKVFADGLPKATKAKKMEKTETSKAA